MESSKDFSAATTARFPAALQAGSATTTTILAYGALLSEASSRLTFPHLTNFRYVRIRGYRRVFAQPHLFLLQQGLIGRPGDTTLRLASLSAEPCPKKPESSFVVAAFDVQLDDEQRAAFVQREASYDIVAVPYFPLEPLRPVKVEKEKEEEEHPAPDGMGVICLASADDRQPPQVLAQLAKDHANLAFPGTIWHWPHDSGLLPANIYLRHCLLAVEKAADASVDSLVVEGARVARDSFWHDTYLADRTTTLAEYLSDSTIYQEVMESRPPPHLATRFGG
ncbi:unnamed protein product [Symbiodinium natans]|uniref:Uncharacterized protein n=1 Tax=Symbiodinium natans TaxID=878477 RepID=A0A812QIX8_9DINO|nr:unnamed protein product [Symbiodinium natans]